MQRQFARYGLALVEVYDFIVAPRISLVVAMKGSLDDARSRCRALADKPAIKEFYGRYPNEWRKHVIRVFSADTAPLGERALIGAWRASHKLRRAMRKAMRRR